MREGERNARPPRVTRQEPLLAPAVAVVADTHDLSVGAPIESADDCALAAGKLNCRTDSGAVFRN